MADELAVIQLRIDRLPGVAEGVIIPVRARHEVVHDQLRDADSAGSFLFPSNAAARHLLGQLGDPTQLTAIGLSRI